MRLAEVTIRNFKGIQDLTITIPKTDPTRPGSAHFVSIVGENNTCKSSVLEAIRLAMPTVQPQKPTIDHFPGKKTENGPIEVELMFDELDEADKAEQGIRTHVHNGQYRIRKVWDTPNADPIVSAFEPELQFPSWPAPDTSKSHFLEAGSEWEALIGQYESQEGTIARINNEVRQGLRDLAVQLQSPVARWGEATWLRNPGGFASHVGSVLPRVIFVPAIRETKEEAEPGKGKSAAREIVQAMFAEGLNDHAAVKKYTEAGEEVRALFSGDEGNEVVRSVEDRITNKLKRFIDIEASLDFTPPDITSDLASRTMIELIDGDICTAVEHQGHGAQRALVLSLLELLAEDVVKRQTEASQFRRQILLLIEEPETYMDPQMCRRMRDVLLTIAKSLTAAVICTTHSPAFLDLADRHDGVVLLSKHKGALASMQRAEDIFEGAPDEDRQRLRMLLNFDPSVNEVFFSPRVCLVEGDCERAAIEAIAARLAELGEMDYEEYLQKRRNVVVVNCRGKWTIPAFQRVLNGFNIPYRVLHDGDAEEDTGANAAILSLLRADETRRRLHQPNFEQQFFGEQWPSDKPWRATRTIREMTAISGDLKGFLAFVLGVPVLPLAGN